MSENGPSVLWKELEEIVQAFDDLVFSLRSIKTAKKPEHQLDATQYAHLLITSLFTLKRLLPFWSVWPLRDSSNGKAPRVRALLKKWKTRRPIENWSRRSEIHLSILILRFRELENLFPLPAMDTWLFEFRLGVVLKGMRSSLRGESPVGCWPTSLQGQQAKSPQSQQVESPPSRREASCLEFPLIDESILESIEKATQGLRDELSQLAVVHRPELVTAAPPPGNGTAATNGRDMEAPAELPDLVTLNQAAAIVHCSKRTMERHRDTGKLPVPIRKGNNGKAHLYDWKSLRSALEKLFDMNLPEKFPANRKT